jgi:hypothetical protein
MKNSLVITFILICSRIYAQDNHDIIKLGAGYAKDFPGLSGYSIFSEYVRSLHKNLEGALGIKRLNLSGYPRTTTVNEYTKATTLDFNLYFLPVVNEVNVLRMGVGYSFSFYKTRRSYPVTEIQGPEKITRWPVEDEKGRASGLIISSEYEYIFASKLSLGIRVSLCKAYDRVFYVGPYAGIRL